MKLLGITLTTILEAVQVIFIGVAVGAGWWLFSAVCATKDEKIFGPISETTKIQFQLEALAICLVLTGVLFWRYTRKCVFWNGNPPKSFKYRH